MKIVVCILAHNEEKYIAQTVASLQNGLKLDLPIYIYANGCKDRTMQISQELESRDPRIHPREILKASKTNAWNTAFLEHADADIMIFSDGDVTPPKGAIEILLKDLENNPGVIITTTRPLPKFSGLPFEKQFVGFIQLPLKHEFLSGGLYAVKRSALEKSFQDKALSGLPLGIIGEDSFLEFLMKPGQLFISACKNYYEPPTFKDYFRYLARIQWQNQQLRLILGTQPSDSVGGVEKLLSKLKGQHELSYLLVSIPAVVARTLFKKIFRGKIQEVYKTLGPVRNDGDKILSDLTRSKSTK